MSNSFELEQLANDTSMLLTELGARFNNALRASIIKMKTAELTRPDLMRLIIETCDDVIDGTNVVRIKAQGLAKHRT